MNIRLNLVRNFLLFSFLITFSLILLSDPTSASDEQYPDSSKMIEWVQNSSMKYYQAAPDSGKIRLDSQILWMFFLHARPLEGAPELDISVPRDLCITLWQNMIESSELTGKEGSIKIGDTDVYWAEVKLIGGMVRTRFYVWDDVKNGRRLIADTNINISLGTPESILLEQQYAMLESIIVGKSDKKLADYQQLKETENFPDRDITLHFPQNSICEIYPGFTKSRPENVPDMQYFSIWVLPKAVNWRYQVVWNQNELPLDSWISGEFSELRGYLKDGSEVRTEVDSIKYLTDENNYKSGEIELRMNVGDQVWKEYWRFSAESWTDKNRKINSLTACEIFYDFWDIPKDGVVEYEVIEKRWKKWRKNLKQYFD